MYLTTGIRAIGTLTIDKEKINVKKNFAPKSLCFQHEISVNLTDIEFIEFKYITHDTYPIWTMPFMNLYLRYFDQETLVTSVDDAIGFLKSIPEIEMDAELEADVREYAASDLTYPKRYKVRPRVYFIVIKTTAQTMQDFKDKKALRTPTPAERMENPVVASLAQEAPGWYEGSLDFKRVVMVPATGKFEYRDTHFVADVKAESGLDCYNRIVDYLRDCVDSRSQFPSAKGKNFHFRYLGMWK